MKILAFAGSLRAGSLNRKLLAVALESLQGKADLDRLDLKEVPMPLYDGDIESREGLPEAALRFKGRIAAADALLIATPEYNNSVPGTLKNAIDWASRPPGNPFRGRVALLMGASPGQFGAVRGVLAVRQVLNALHAIVLPQTIQIPHADQAFDEAGRLKDPKSAALVEKACAELLRVAALLKG
ncbi:MAG TPA: NAD(P)H-dependent oxidoreductase [Candidatus Polarisedimenticolia bacterium]|jgi:chromate reductase|nr:NAD(P)H-dependent oxidoreductase [Candidatus Polarisedimenticolia bacterium]